MTEKRYVLKNPLKRGYSANTVSANIAEMKRAGVPEKQAIAAAFEEARKAWKKRHGRKALPPHLKVNAPGRKVVKKNVRHKTGRKSTPRRSSGRRGVVDQEATPGYIIETSGKHGGLVTITESKRGTIRKNPVGGKFKKAVQLYKDFTGDEPQFIDEWIVSVPPVAVFIGKLTGVMYTATRDGKSEEFYHEFKRGKPILAASAEGHQLLILGGKYHFTERGIVDGTASFRR